MKEKSYSLIDTHTHLFDEVFSDDLPQVIERAKAIGVSHVFMPNIDSTTIKAMLSVCDMYKGYCSPMIGLHPTSVNENYERELSIVAQYLASANSFVAIGEIGIDLYWDKTYQKEQQIAFVRQVELALKYNLPIVIHCRKAFNLVYDTLKLYKSTTLSGIFHSFTGEREDIDKMLEFGNFFLGINGIVTFKKSSLPEVLPSIPIERIVLETDSPYLSPVPNRGKRNETANLKYVQAKVADVYHLSLEQVAEITTKNALSLFEGRRRTL